MLVSIPKKSLPYGLWHSPITPAMLSQQKRLYDVQWDSNVYGTLVWLEGRSDRGVLVSLSDLGGQRDLTVEQNVRAGVGYGGGDFTISNGTIIFAERDGRLYRRYLSADLPRSITPPFGYAASPVLSPDNRWVVYVFSDGREDLLGLTDAEGREWPNKLVYGTDFYMQPVWHPTGGYLAWIEWNHSNMPWDGTRLMICSLSGIPPQAGEKILIAGDEQTPVSQPRFSPDGKWLSYITADGDWDDLVIMNMTTREKQVLVKGDHFLLAPPAWVQGIHSYGWTHDSQRIFYLRTFAGLTTLWVVDLETRKSTQIDVRPYTWLGQLSVSPVDDQLAFVASAPTIPDRIMRWDGRNLRVVCRSESEDIAPEYFSDPSSLCFTSKDGDSVYGIFYPPVNKDYTASGLPPVIINIHGGPTSSVDIRYSPGAAYHTTRGYAYLEVNYRGSTGYGHSYERALRQRWGNIDVEDAVCAAQALVDQHLVDGNRMVIKGGSAGGYTVLNALIRYPGKFKAGICLYGVSNLFSLAMETHKFEEKYTDSMVGVLPETAGRYHAWSPIFHADRVRDPLAVFQGSIDRVVPPNQSEEIVKELQKRNIPHVYRLYEGEGHGFRKSESIIDYYQQVDRFLKQFVLFAADKQQ